MSCALKESCIEPVDSNLQSNESIFTRLIQKARLQCQHDIKFWSNSNNNPKNLPVIIFSRKGSYTQPEYVQLHKKSFYLGMRHPTKKKIAVVIPFPGHQLDNVKKSLQRWKNVSYFPCLTPATNTDLVFYFDTVMKDYMKQDLQSEVLTFRSCFKNVVFYDANLTPAENSYPRGPNNQWFKIYLNPNNYIKKTYDHFFYMEPDVTVIRAGWVNELERLVNAWPVPFWIAGSIYLGTKTIRQPYHLNGNAIYSFSDQFIERIVKQAFTMCLQNPFMGYDEVISIIVHNEKTQLYREVLQYFVPIDFIQNKWHTKWEEEDIKKRFPNTYLIHGGFH